MGREAASDQCEKDNHRYWRLCLDCIQEGVKETVWVVVHCLWEVAQDVDQSWPVHRHDAEQIDNKRSVVAPTNACPEPLAVMIESVHAVPTKVTVECALRSEDLARVAKLQPWHVAARSRHYEWMNSTSRIFASRLSDILYGSCSQIL